jgi:hypothetical protein
MTEPGKHSEIRARNAAAERRDAAREPAEKTLNADIRARIARPHKGDVGRPETNEEIFQGFKEKELR